jgi:arylsulfatase A-like enzyme
LEPETNTIAPARLRDRFRLRFRRSSRTLADPAKLPTALHAYALFVVLFGFPGVLKVIKAVHVARDGLRASDLAHILASDLALGCFASGVFLALARALHRRRLGAWLLGLASALGTLPLLELSAIEHQTWSQSSSLLDWNVLWYTWRHYQELRPVIAAETTASGVLLLVGAGLLALAPALVDMWAARTLGLALPASVTGALLLVLSAAPSAWFGSLPPGAAELCPLSASASLGLIKGAFGAAKKVVHGKPNFAVPDAGRSKERIRKALAAAHLALSPNDARPKNVLLVVLESTRFDATSLYVPRLGTTPRLVGLAEHGAVAQRAYAAVPHTSKALVSILCGYSPRFSVQVNETEPGGITRPCLPHILGELGYRRAFFQAAAGTFENRHEFALNAGYDQIFTRESYDETGFEEVNYLAVEDKVMVKPIMRWIEQEQQQQQPFFLTVLTCITHHSYGLPSHYPLREFPPTSALPGARTPRPWPDYNRYLNTVEYADEFMGELLDGLQKLGRLDDTLVIVVGDHGQGFEEHGQRAHNTVIWDEGLHVPLVFGNAKLFPEQRAIEGVRRQEDIAPTILSALSVSYPPDMFEGNDMLSAPQHPYVYSSCWYDRRCAAETGARMRFIDHFDHQPMEAFDLLADPVERHNLLLSGTPKDRVRWSSQAKAARARMQAFAHEIDLRWDAERDDEVNYILDREPTPTYPLHALLGDWVEVLGYDAATDEVVPDGFWDAVVYFKCKKPSAPGWRLFGVLETADGRQEQTDYHPANGRLFLHECKAGTIVADRLRVWIPGDFPPGAVRFWWGSVLLKQLGSAASENPRLERSEITPLERGVLVNDDAVLLAKLEVKPQYRPALAELLKASVLTQAPKIDKPLNVRFGDQLELLDVQATPAEPRRLASITIRSTWRVLGKQPGPWQIAVAIESHEARRWVRRAHTPVDGIHPIANWQAGTFVVDTDTMPVPDKMPTGEATIWLSLRSSDDRMRITSAGRARVEDGRVQVAKIQVKE